MDSRDERLEELIDSDFARGFRKLRKSYGRFRRGVLVGVLIIGLGSAYGIREVNHLSEGRKNDSNIAINSQCWGTYNGRSVLRALVNRPTNTKFNTARIKDPELRGIIVASNKGSVQFKKFAFQYLDLPKCHGSNPNPLDPVIQRLAQAPHR